MEARVTEGGFQIKTSADGPPIEIVSDGERFPIVNARRCGVCGAGADRYEWGLQCQANPSHLGDSFLGIFSDHSWPEF